MWPSIMFSEKFWVFWANVLKKRTFKFFGVSDTQWGKVNFIALEHLCYCKLICVVSFNHVLAQHIKGFFIGKVHMSAFICTVFLMTIKHLLVDIMFTFCSLYATWPWWDWSQDFDWASQGSFLIFFNHSNITLVLYFGSLSTWKVHFSSSSADWNRLSLSVLLFCPSYHL